MWLMKFIRIRVCQKKLRFSKGGEILIPRVGEDPGLCKMCLLASKDIAIGEMISVYNTKENPLFLTYYFNTKMKYEFAKEWKAQVFLIYIILT